MLLMLLLLLLLLASKETLRLSVWLACGRGESFGSSGGIGLLLGFLLLLLAGMTLMLMTDVTLLCGLFAWAALAAWGCVDESFV